MVKKIILLSFVFSAVFFPQIKNKKLTGKISFVSPTMVYVSFPSTQGIQKGDTLFLKLRKKTIPVLKVKYKSSRSVAAAPFASFNNLKKNMPIFAFVNVAEEKTTPAENPARALLTKAAVAKVKWSKNKVERKSSEVYGRVSLSSYSNFSNITGTDYQRWRFSSSFNALNIAGSNVSFTSYFNFKYRADQWSALKNRPQDYLTVYDLALSYKPSESVDFWIGRRINPNLNNVGAIDGANINVKAGGFIFGAVAGSRPNFADYGLNSKLFEYGAYIGREDSLGGGTMKTNIAFFQQTNHGKTDRRFVYLQHNNNLFKNVYFYFSTEIDLYKKINGIEKSDFKFTSIYFSLRFRFSRRTSLSVGYDARRNVIYYETYKSFAERLLDDAARQGFRFRFSFRPFAGTYASINGSFNNRRGDPKPSYNAGFYISYSRIPYLNATASLNEHLVSTSFILGNIASLRFSRYIFNGLLYLSGGYKNIYYSFPNNAPEVIENVLMLDLGMSITTRLNFSVSYEGILEGIHSYGRIFLNISQRF